MSAMQDILNARKDAVNQAKGAGAIEGSANPDKLKQTAPKLDTAPGVIDTEVISSGGRVSNQLPTGGIDEERAKEAKAVYKTLSLRKFFNSNGAAVLPVDGYYYATDDEQVDMLDHYASAGKVEKL